MIWRVISVFSIALVVVLSAPSKNRNKNRGNGDLSLWIDEHQVKMISGLQMNIYAIMDGNVLPYIRDPNFERHLPVIPSEINSVNFTWKSGARTYNYHFDRLESFDEGILLPPAITIDSKGKIPKKPKMFSVQLPCSGKNSGIASFSIGLTIERKNKQPLPGTPLRLNLRKECAQRGPDPECDKKCANGGYCNKDKICQCKEGYMGQYCTNALCYPQCVNNGTCTAPGTCTCPPGFHGHHCEGGICSQKCENGGKCVQKDTCECPKGFYGLRCEFSKCIIPCLNGGKCKGINKCRCFNGYRGDHCEIFTCTRPCKHGICTHNNTCVCDPGWAGKLCQHSFA
uniref:Wnt inhibitory factor 1 n=2 Tax=Lygus hesperus TaxID=30085 RepID=A0A0K8TC46_LYGHE